MKDLKAKLKTKLEAQLKTEHKTQVLILIAVAAIACAFFAAQNSTNAWYWVLGIAFGYALQHSSLCFNSMTNEIFIVSFTTQFRSVLMGILVGSIGITVIKYFSFGTLDYLNVSAIGGTLVIGAFIFGMGMTLAGCCASGMFVRLAEGNSVHIITLIYAILGYVLANIQYEDIWSPLDEHSLSVFLPRMFGWIGGVAIHLVIIILLYVLALRREKKSFGDVIPNEPTDHWKYTTGAILLGLIAIVEYITVQNGPSITGGFYIVAENDISLETVGPLVFDIGVFMGAFTSTAARTGLRFVKITSLKQTIPSMIGGFLIGYGSRVAGGCNISSFFGAAASLSLSGWVFMIFLFAGVFIGLKILNKFFV